MSFYFYQVGFPKNLYICWGGGERERERESERENFKWTKDPYNICIHLQIFLSIVLGKDITKDCKTSLVHLLWVSPAFLIFPSFSLFFSL